MTEKERIEEFHAYLDENLIQYTCPTPYTVKIGGRVFELYKPAYDGSIFDDAFGFKGLPVDPEHKGNMEPFGDCYTYKFGGVWYWLPKGDETNVKLRRLKYLGKARQTMFDGQGVYLGVHGQYEILSGSGTYADWCNKAKFLNYSALGICELNTLAGALKFQQECQKNGLKPVIGMECTVFDETNGYKFTVKVFVRNVQGWQDILTINKFINCDNPKYISLKDFNKITRGNGNLILILDPKTLDYDKLAQMRIDTVLFQLDPVEYTDNERDRVYLENLKKFFTSKLLPVTMTDAWYLDPEYSSIRQRLNSIGGTQSYDSDDQYMKGDDDVFFELQKLIPEEDNFAEYFYDVYSEARQRLIDIVEGVDFTIDVSRRHLPRYVMTPEESQKYTDNEDMFWGLIAEGLERHPDLIETWGEDVVMERINREVDTIKYGDTIDYFLITRDIVNWCHENGIMTGISRGSAGGCLISYLLGITKLDPLKYNLLFERFLNKGRVKKSLPDIDVDFPGITRDRVKKYMEDRFGAFQVASVGTYSALQLRAAMKDLSRLYGLQFQEVNEMMKLFSVDDRKPEDLFYKACASSTVKEFVKGHPDLVNEVMLVMPAPKAQSIHACATMIFPTEHDMFRWVPIRKVGNEYVTEWEGTEMDSAGFLKQDILGIKQLDKFQEMVRLIKENEGVDIDIFSVPLDDPEVYRYFQEGWTEDNFHFGSRGLTGYCQKMKPENIEDLIAAISLYRPGAMENGFHEDYIKRKNGNDGQPIEYWVGAEQALKSTYGVIVYQEQVMELCRTLGGLSMVEADDVRKAMVKKKYEALAQYHERFTPYYVENFGVTKEYAEDVWNAIDKASEYLFNRSHAAAYAITGYISQWLKVHYPIEYWSVAFHYAQEGDSPRYIAEINKTGVCQVKPVDINISSMGVVIDFKSKALYWSLMGVKQVAERAAEQILSERKENGQYWSLTDFISRHKWKGSAINSRVVKNLILAGAFDGIEGIVEPYGRVELLVKYMSETKSKIDPEDPVLKGCDDFKNVSVWWSLMQKQISGLAFFDYEDIFKKYVPKELFEGYRYAEVRACLETEKPVGYVTIGGYLTDIDVKTTRRGNSQMAKITLENNYDFIEVIAFADNWQRYQQDLLQAKGSLVFISGQLDYDSHSGNNVLKMNKDSIVQSITL